MKLTIKDLGYSVGSLDILKGVDLELLSGNCCALLGPNGAGKSTLMKVASGYLRPTSGQVLLNGTPINSLSLMRRARQMAVLTQKNSLDFPFTAEEIVVMGRSPYGISVSDSSSKSVIAALGINGHNTYTHLSGGEKQLVQLARVFSQVWERGQEACLLLDEPMTALDLNHQKVVVGLLRKFATEGTTQLIVMHDINMALEIADIIVLMSGGKVIEVGPASKALTTEALERTFRVPISVLQDGQQRFYKTKL